MLISRTPFRISLFGGGTDFPQWFNSHGGAVLSTTIDKYTYITCRRLPQFFDHKHRIVYSKIENVTNPREIAHPAIRAVFQDLQIEDGIELHCDADLPARSGIGSSSSFSVGLYHALTALQGRRASKTWLAKMAIRLEREILSESGGWQDQIASSFGGLNIIRFHPQDSFTLEPLVLKHSRKEEIESWLMLFFTGFSRDSSSISRKNIDAVSTHQAHFNQLRALVDDAASLISSDQSLDNLGHLLNESWELKKDLNESVSSTAIDCFYQKALNSGACGGKLIGAGNGGFMLLIAPPDSHQRIISSLSDLLHVPFHLENSGSTIIYYD